MFYGAIMGKMLRVDLGVRTVQEESIPNVYISDYIGGDGLAARILYDEVPIGTSALDPENELVVSAGPLAGTAVQASCNCSVAAKSPITGFTIYNSHFNGNFARMLKFAGFDTIIIEGKADSPVFLWLNEGKTEIKDALSLWGKDTYETEEALKKELRQPKLSSMCIGPAGENLVTLSGILSDTYHVAGRGGLGAVMGSKNLKAIAVYGSRKVPIADSNRFMALAREWRKINISQPFVKDMSKFGTPGSLAEGGFATSYRAGDVPIKNWSRGTIEGWEKLTGQYMVEKMFKRHVTCPSCTIAHNKVLELRGGAFSGEYKMPEYEITSAMGSNIGVTDPTVVAKGSELLNRYGLDGLGTSNVIGLVMECYEKGLITNEDTEGLDIRFGNWEAAFKIMEKIAKRDGLGDILADGPVRAADFIGKGADRLIVHVKGMPLPMHDHRSAWGYALQYAVGSAGPGHEGGPLSRELSGELPRFSTEGKAAAVKAGQEFRCFTNTLGICGFGAVGVPLEKIADTMSAATGLKLDKEEASKVAMRIVNLRRAFNIRHGLVPEDDTLPPRYTLEPPPDGGAQGSVVPIKPMVYDYYKLMGWDLKTGKPYRRTLLDLGLENVAKDLWG
jgi:aldehyde:ferredoxin oxidoreductase